MQKAWPDFSSLSMATIAKAVAARDDRLWNESYFDKSGLLWTQQEASGQIA